MPIDPNIILAGQRPPEQVDPMGVLGKVMTLRNQQAQGATQQQDATIRGQQIQENNLKLASMQRVTAGRAALTSILQDPASVDPATGKVQYQAVAQKLGQAGFDDMAESWLKQSASNAEVLDKIDATAKAHAEAVLEAIGGLAASATSARDFDTGLGLLATQHVIDGPTAQQYAQQADAAGPDGWRQLAAQFVKYAPSSRKAALENTAALQKPTTLGPGQNLVIPATGQTVASGGSNSTKESKSVLVDGKPSEVVFDNKSGAYTQGGQTIAPSRVRPIPPASMTINPAMIPSGDALDMAAKKYLATGELPSMGMGQAGVAARIAVMNRAAAIDPQASLAANKAVYKSDTANLTKLQTTEGILSAFEKTAGKNLDQFLTLAAKIPDTGTPWLNVPVRLLNEKMVGSANMAAINAARDVALREIARVTNDPKLSGALTDSARAEVLGLSGKDATLPQIKAVAKVLKQDMANVHAGVNEQIATVKQGLGSNPAAPPQPPQGGTIRARDPQGVLHQAPAGTPLPAGWKLEG